jgi:hypothetical protein
MSVQGYLKKTQIQPLDLSQYKDRVGDPILIEASNEIGLIGVEVTIDSDDNTLIKSGKAVESSPETGK